MLRHMPIEAEGLPMNMERKVSFFRNGRNQAVRIPKEFETQVKQGLMRKEGTRLIIETAPEKPSLGEWLAMQEPLAPEDQMPFIADYPPEPVNL